MSDDGDAVGIDGVIGLEVIHRPAGAPGPGAESAPRIARPRTRSFAFEQPDDAVPVFVLVVWGQLRVVESGNAISTLDQSLGRPEIRLEHARRVGVVR